VAPAGQDWGVAAFDPDGEYLATASSDNTARVWDTVVRVGGRPEREHRRELVGGVRGRVLEFGAGTGLNFELYPQEARVLAIEPEPTMARRAWRRARDARASVCVLRASAEALPFKEGVFDVAVACYVLCTIPDPRRALGEVRRVLAANGQLRFYEHVRSAHPRWARWQDRLTPAWRFIGAGCHPEAPAPRIEALARPVGDQRFPRGD
jgi:ubiquinone/menaquinone biosynthesis C-methylase UbiE